MQCATNVLGLRGVRTTTIDLVDSTPGTFFVPFVDTSTGTLGSTLYISDIIEITEDASRVRISTGGQTIEFAGDTVVTRTGQLDLVSDNLVTTGDLTGTNVTGTLQTVAQPNVTSTRSIKTVAGTVTVGQPNDTIIVGNSASTVTLACFGSADLVWNGTYLTNSSGTLDLNTDSLTTTGALTGGSLSTAGYVSAANISTTAAVTTVGATGDSVAIGDVTSTSHTINSATGNITITGDLFQSSTGAFDFDNDEISTEGTIEGGTLKALNAGQANLYLQNTSVTDDYEVLQIAVVDTTGDIVFRLVNNAYTAANAFFTVQRTANVIDFIIYLGDCHRWGNSANSVQYMRVDSTGLVVESDITISAGSITSASGTITNYVSDYYVKNVANTAIIASFSEATNRLLATTNFLDATATIFRSKSSVEMGRVSDSYSEFTSTNIYYDSDKHWFRTKAKTANSYLSWTYNVLIASGYNQLSSVTNYIDATTTYVRSKTGTNFLSINSATADFQGLATTTTGLATAARFYGYQFSYDQGADSTGSGIFCQKGYVGPTNYAGAASDNLNSFGVGSFRWTAIFAVNGTIQTSDRREKKNIALVNDVETRVGLAIAAVTSTYKWVERSNDKTRVGVVAQDMSDCFVREGLDPLEYSMFDVTELEDQAGVKTGEERLGINYAEMNSMCIGALAREVDRLSAIIARIPPGLLNPSPP